MSKEEKEYKIEVLLFEYGELVQFNKMLDNDLDNIVNKVTKQVLRDKELIFMQKIIEKQQKEIEELKKYEEYFINGFFEDFLNGYISKDKIREKIKELESIGRYKLDHKDLYLEQESIDLLEELLEEGR